VGNTIGVASIVTDDIGSCNISENNIGIRMPKDMKTQQKSFLVTYLNSITGQNQILRAISGNAQPKLNVADIEEVKVPHVSDRLMGLTHQTFELSTRLIHKSKNKYNQSQTILLSELCLINWQPKHQLTFIKNYSNTKQAERIDAEYFQPKYEEIIKAIKNYAGGWNTLGNLVIVKKCVEVGSGEYLDEGIPFVRVSNLSPFEITEEKYISEKLYAEIKQHQPKKGEILFSKDATPGIAYYLHEQPKKMIPSGGILRLKSKTDKINNEYLTLVLNSILTKEQVNRDVGGSVILHWRPDQVKSTIIPVLSEEKQAKIQQKVTESFNLRKQSKNLLECSKRAVEMAIEQDEQTAIKWLEKQIEFDEGFIAD
jgi:restriction endonuclease S subunit